MLFGLKSNFNTSGHIVINSDIKNNIFVPFKIKFINNVYKYDKSGSYLKIAEMSALSNGTGVFVLKVNVDVNNRIYEGSSYLPYYEIKKTVEEEERFAIPISNQPGFSLSMPNWEYKVQTNVRPVKYLISYDNTINIIIKKMIYL